MDLPRSVQEIADVIGRERALYLIGKLPVYTVRDKRGHVKDTRVILYVPKTLAVDSDLVKILGWNDASKMVRYFGGELLYPGNCKEIYRRFIIQTIKRMCGEGIDHKIIAHTLEVSERTVKRHCTDNPHKDPKPANDNHRERQLLTVGL